MIRNNYLFLLAIILPILYSCSTSRNVITTVSPNSFGFQNAKNGEERYEALYKAHQYALEHNLGVDYSGLNRIELVIPQNAKSFPLTSQTDFKGTVFHVLNKQKNMFLFEMGGSLQPITDISPEEVDKKRYSTDKLKKGVYLLIINDKNPWVDNRNGYSYGANRKDIILVKDGRGLNTPISTYTKKSSSAQFSYRHVDNKEKIFSNIILDRDARSTKMTQLVNVNCQNNLIIKNIRINTPESTMYGEAAISVSSSTNVTFDNILINGTYSLKDKYGYGISMNNVWNVKCSKLVSKSNWGVWCCSNVQQVSLYNCDINRFDVHCYGRDIACYNCVISGWGGQYSSVFGDVVYDCCTFNNAPPYINRPDYNAYVDFNLYLTNCIFNASANKSSLIELRRIDNVVNGRDELKEKRLPNIYIKNLIVTVPEKVERFYLFKTDKENTYESGFGHLSEIIIDGLTVKTKRGAKMPALMLSSAPMRLKMNLRCEIKKAELVVLADSNKEVIWDWFEKPGYFVSNLSSYVATSIKVNGSRLNYNVQ